MRRMPVFRSADTRASARTAGHPNHLAFRSLIERPEVTHTSSSPSTNSPSGSKPNPSPRSQPPRPRNSSKILWSDSAFPTGSSRTTAHNSLGQNSKIGAKSSASRSAMLLWRTHRVTGRSSVPMAWCSRASSQGSSIGSNLTQASGRENCHPNWALRTSPSRATGESPFFLTYGSEAVLPTELEFRSPRVRNFNEKQSEDSRLEDLDQLEEARDIAAIQLAIYLQGLRRYHDHNIRGRAFCTGDLVLCKVQKRTHKLSATWEGPYIIAEMTRPGAYKLKNRDGTSIYPDHSWNIDQLHH